MFTSSVAFLLSVMLAVLLTPLVRTFALERGLVDQGGARKIHRVPTPRLGGIAIVAAFYFPLTVLLFYETALGAIFWRDETRAVGLFVGGISIALLGLADDLRNLAATTKLFWQCAIATLMYAMGFQIDVIANPFGTPLELGAIGMPLTVLWIVGVTNAMNLIDGLDGLAAGVGLFATSTIFMIAFTHGDARLCLFTAALGGALIGFLFYNFNPATIFMGDTGSMFIGFILATASIQSAQKSSTAVALLIPIVTLGLPILDTLLAIGRRAAAGKPLFAADRDHIHHRLLTMGLSHRQAALVLYGICLLLAGAAWILTRANSGQSAVILAWLFIMSYLFIRKLGYVQFQGQVLFEQKRRARGLTLLPGEGAGQVLDRAEVKDGWAQLRRVGAEVGAAQVSWSMDLSTDGGESLTCIWRAELVGGAGRGVELRLPVRLGPGVESAVVVVFPAALTEVTADQHTRLQRALSELESTLGPAEAPSAQVA